MWKSWQSIILWQRILGALVLGIVIGYALNATGNSEYAEYTRPIGTMFINAIKMLMIPIIVTTLISAITSLGDPERLGRVGLKTFGLYMVTTALAILIGFVVTWIIQPGAGAGEAVLAASGDTSLDKKLSLTDIFVGLVPSNPIAAMAEGNALQIIVFTILIGLCINLVGEKAEPVKRFFDAGAEVIYKLVHLVMEVAPFGVLALMITVVGTLGLEQLKNLFWLALSLHVACFLHIILVHWGAIAFVAKLNPARFIRGIIDAQAVAYSTGTSTGTIPVTMSNVEGNLGVSKKVASVVIPLGATINMDGTALYVGLITIFTAQALGVTLDVSQYFIIIVTGVLISIGAAGIPSASLFIMPVVLSAVGLPLGAIALVLPIDKILDMMRTFTNVTGDAMVSVLVAKSEGELDLDVYNHKAVE